MQFLHLGRCGFSFLMSKKQTTKNQVAWSSPPSTPESTALQGMVGQSDFSTPIRNNFARAERNLSRSYNNPLGQYTTPGVRDSALRSQKFDLNQNLGAALGNAALQNQQNTFSQQSDVAQLTQPRMYGSQSQTKFHDPFGQAMQIAGLVTSGASGGKAGAAGG